MRREGHKGWTAGIAILAAAGLAFWVWSAVTRLVGDGLFAAIFVGMCAIVLLSISAPVEHEHHE